jgi:glycosyltransferase involved in cell wall biosynthesis
MLTSRIQDRLVVEPTNKLVKFIFISSCCEYWGGSEELWSEAARYLQGQGFGVTAFKNRVNNDWRINDLRTDGIAVKDIQILVSLIRKISYHSKISNLLLTLLKWFKYDLNEYKQEKITSIVISQGENYDGVEIARVCLELNLPYIIISQKASDSVWPHGIKRQIMREVYQQAQATFFVSQHNLSLTEAQLGYKLLNAEVVRNPHRSTIAEALPYPKLEHDRLKIACVGRLWILDKGQDILLRVLAQSKWRERNLHVSFFGAGVDRAALMDMANLLELENVSFPGFVENITDIWHHHHALIMPSRAEGLPIALVEAMMCGRLGIVTDVGGVCEVVADEMTGFIAASACVREIDRVLELAWQRREQWEDIGKAAASSIRQQIPPDPERIFADRLVQLGTSIDRQRLVAKNTELS